MKKCGFAPVSSNHKKGNFGLNRVFLGGVQRQVRRLSNQISSFRMRTHQSSVIYGKLFLRDRVLNLEVFLKFRFLLRVMKTQHCVWKCPESEFFWSVFSCIWTKYLEMRSISPYKVRIQENTDQRNFKYGHFSRIDFC